MIRCWKRSGPMEKGNWKVIIGPILSREKSAIHKLVIFFKDSFLVYPKRISLNTSLWLYNWSKMQWWSLALFSRQVLRCPQKSSPLSFHPYLAMGFLALMVMEGGFTNPSPFFFTVLTTITSLKMYFWIAGRPKKKKKVKVRESWRQSRDVLKRQFIFYASYLSK